jgi:hypothetical protein
MRETYALLPLGQMGAAAAMEAFQRVRALSRIEET